MIRLAIPRNIDSIIRAHPQIQSSKRLLVYRGFSSSTTSVTRVGTRMFRTGGWVLLGIGGIYVVIVLGYSSVKSKIERMSWIDNIQPSALYNKTLNLLQSFKFTGKSFAMHSKADSTHKQHTINNNNNSSSSSSSATQAASKSSENKLLSGLALGDASLIEMYHEVLELLSGIEDSINSSSEDISDQLPRVVVVGDQSAGKTSVLEMLARARFLPRGAGEMMTRSPVTITLMEGERHEAVFTQDQAIFNLQNETELKALRLEIEQRMLRNIRSDQTVSSEPVSLIVRGPGLPKMVLVDLPGVISTVTTGMAKHTREAITDICRKYLSNPNAIILCVQDGSVDAERSNVTDLVSEADPEGTRTVVVLTKIDMAEKQGVKFGRLQSILNGQVLPLEALKYFAVVTGRGNANDSIETIEQYESNFFEQSQLTAGGYVTKEQTGTSSLSLTVANLFWELVKNSINEQLLMFQEAYETLNLEWNSSFPSQRIMDRDELFDTAKGLILDAITKLNTINGGEWELRLKTNMMNKVLPHLFDEVIHPSYISAATNNKSNSNLAREKSLYSPVKFKVKADTIMRQKWSQIWLPSLFVDTGRDLLLEELLKQIEVNLSTASHSRIFEPLQGVLLDKLRESYEWKQSSKERLKTSLQSVIRDKDVRSEEEWHLALAFMKQSVRERMELEKKHLQDAIGNPSWVPWRGISSEQKENRAILDEIKKVVNSRGGDYMSVTLEREDYGTIKKNVSYKNISVTDNRIKYVWTAILNQKHLGCTHEKSIRCIRTYHKQINDPSAAVECHEVYIFHILQHLLDSASKEARIQMQNEIQELELQTRKILIDLSSQEHKRQLLCGELVDLSDKIQRVRVVIDRLDKFSLRLAENI